MSTENEQEESVEFTAEDVQVIEEINERSPEADPQTNELEETDVDLGDKSVQDETGSDDNSADQQESDQKNDFDPELLSHAEYYGLNPDDFASEQVLAQVIDGYEAGNAQLAQWQQWYRNQNQGQGEQQQGDGTIPPEQQSLARPDFTVGLGDDYDEGLKEAINALAGQMASHYDQQLELVASHIINQQGAVDGYYQQQQQDHALSEIDAFDNAVNSLGNSGLFGDGSFLDLEPNSNVSQARENLYSQVNVLRSGYYNSGQDAPEYGELVRQAYNTVFSDEVKQQSQSEVTNRLRGGQSKRLGGGTTTQYINDPDYDGDDPVNDSKLKDAYEGFLRENGDI